MAKAFLKTTKKLVKWYRLAAEQGNAKAQNNLGVMYEYWQRRSSRQYFGSYVVLTLRLLMVTISLVNGGIN